MTFSLSTSLNLLRTRYAQQQRSRSASGRICNTISYVFSLFCLYRVFTISFSAFRRYVLQSPNPNKGSDPITTFLALLAKHYDPKLDQTAWVGAFPSQRFPERRAANVREVPPNLPPPILPHPRCFLLLRSPDPQHLLSFPALPSAYYPSQSRPCGSSTLRYIRNLCNTHAERHNTRIRARGRSKAFRWWRNGMDG